MDRVITMSLLTLALLSSTRTAPNTDFIPDEENAEIAVPRSPSLKGPHTEYVSFPVGTKGENLTCEVDGTPMPKVVWLRNGMGVQQLNQPLEVEFYPDDGLSVLFLPDFYFSEDSGMMMLPGNYTCVAANFLGRASKTYIVTLMESTTIISTMASVKTVETTKMVTTLSS